MVRVFFLILIFILLVLTFNSFYNQEKEALAFEYEIRCEILIPTGHAIDATQRITQEIIDNLGIILQESKEQIDQAQNMINLANQCDRARCSTGCEKWTEDHSECVAEDEEGNCIEWHTWTTYHCAVKPCSGDACDFSGIATTLSQIKENYNKINQSQEKIEKDIEKAFQEKSPPDQPPTIIEMVKSSRAGLKYCAGFVKLPEIEEMTEEEIESLMKRRKIGMLLSCSLAQDVEPGLECHFNDFFCCY